MKMVSVLQKEASLMPTAKVKKSKYFSYLLRFAVAALALYLAFRGEDLKQVAAALLGLNLWVFTAALGLYFVSQLVFVLRWCVLLRVQSIKIEFWLAVRLHFLGLFYNNCLPSSVGGDFVRAWYVAKHTDKKLPAALSVFVDRVVGLAGLIIMAFVGYWFIPAHGRKQLFESSYKAEALQLPIEHRQIIIVIATFLAVVIITFLVSFKARMFLLRAFRDIRQRGSEVLSKTCNAIRIYYNDKLALVYALLITFCCQGIFITALWLIGREIGIAAHMKYYFIFLPISWILGTLPISPGGGGVVECAVKVMFTQVLAVPGELALVLALCQRLLWVVGSLPGVAIHLTGSHLPKNFSIHADEPVAGS
jgi:uncharacterized protein (TIRG00374 family)